MIRRALALGVVVAAVVAGLPLATRTTAAPLLIGRVHESFQPTTGKVFVLVIGNDARSGNPDQSRADAIHIVGINAETMRGGILNFPRDSWVSIPGHGAAKMNEALYRGGPELLAKTLENLTGIRLDYWVMVGFEGFSDIIDELGGVRMRIPRPVYDPTGSGAHIDPGVKNLGRYGALAYVRTRHSFPNGDIDRTTNQGRFLIAMLKKLHRQVERDPAALLHWVDVTTDHTRLDLSPAELFRLGVLATEVDPARVENVTVPVSIGAVGAASVVFISPAAGSIYKRFERTGSL